jgi:hypothetical protein
MVEGDARSVNRRGGCRGRLPSGRAAATIVRMRTGTLVIVLLIVTLASARAQPPNQSVLVSTSVVTVEKLERASRGLICRTPDGIAWAITVDRNVDLYDDLAEGDVIVVHYIDAVLVQLKPGAKLTNLKDITEDARGKVVDPAVRLDQQWTAVVTIDEIDAKANAVVYHGPDNRRVVRIARDPQLLNGLRPGDIVEVTMTRERAVSIERAQP